MHKKLPRELKSKMEKILDESGQRTAERVDRATV